MPARLDDESDRLRTEVVQVKGARLVMGSSRAGRGKDRLFHCGCDVVVITGTLSPAECRQISAQMFWH